MLRCLDFNSIKVRLELFINGINNTESIFQFHKGAIRTLQQEEICGLIVQFQFHKGAIRTNKSKQFDAMYEDFNSIKVRLEQ